MAWKPNLEDQVVKDPCIDHLESLEKEIANSEIIEESERLLGARDVLTVPAAFRWLSHTKITTENTFNFTHQVAVMVANKLNKRLVRSLSRVLDKRFREIEYRLRDLENRDEWP